MIPPANFNRRAEPVRRGSLALAVAIGVGAALLLVGILVVLILLIRRRKRRANAAPSYHVSAPPLRSHAHEQNKSDASVNPLLMQEIKGDWDYKEKFVPPPRRSTDEERGDRDIISNNLAGLYHIPSSHAHSPISPAPSSFCLHGLDTKSFADHPYRTPPTERPPLPPLPPLIIPDNRHTGWYFQSQIPATVAEEQLPSQPPSSCPSSVSLYSQTTAETPSGSPAPHFHIPLPQEVTFEPLPPEDDGLQRGDTYLVGNLLKARAQRNPGGLIRASSQISHIERTGSIKSVGPIHGSDRPYARRYRSKKKSRLTLDMDVVKEGSEAGSLRSRSDSSAAHFDPAMLQAPLPVVTSPYAPLLSKP